MSIRHHRYLKLVSASVDGRLSRTEAALLDVHCRKCRSCRNALHDLQKLHGLLAENGAAAVPPFFMTRLHARLGKEPAPLDPWGYEAIRLFPIFSGIAIILIVLIVFGPKPQGRNADELLLGSVTPAEHRVLLQSGVYTKDEVLALSLTDGRENK